MLVIVTRNLLVTCGGIQNARCKERLNVLRYAMPLHVLAYSKIYAPLVFYVASSDNFLYHYSLCNIAEKHSSQLLRGGNPKCCLFLILEECLGVIRDDEMKAHDGVDVECHEFLTSIFGTGQ